jgi:uncharacterized protein (TIGR00730 family)
MEIKRVCVFCASSSQINHEFLDSAFKLGSILASQKIEVVYGGGSLGSMGALADGVLKNNGQLIGVIPEFMMKLEWGNPNVTQMYIVDTMAQRKEQMIKNVDAIVVLPGGTGTLEEMAEAISLKKLGLFLKPIVILNTNGFFNHFLLLIDKMIDENFVRPEHKNIFSVTSSPGEVLSVINSSPAWGEETIRLAAL